MMNSRRSLPAARYHAVRFYENDNSLSQIVADFIGDGLAAGDPGVVVATPAQRATIVRALVARSFDVVELQESDTLILLDATSTLETFLVNGVPNGDRFKSRMCAVIARACRGRENCTVRIYGQMVDILWKDRREEAAIRLELLWNQLAYRESFALLCGYAMGHFYKGVNVDEICRHHTHVVSASGESAAIA